MVTSHSDTRNPDLIAAMTCDIPLILLDLIQLLQE